MSSYDFLAIGLLVLAIGVNSGLVYLQKTRGLYDRFGPSAYRVHGAILTVFWGSFIGSEFLVSRSSWRLGLHYPLAGGLVMIMALALFCLALQQIGWPALSNGNFFGQPIRKLGGVYRYIREPIYWSYTIWFAGIGLVTGQKAFFVISLVSLIGLVGIEAWVERPTASS